MPSEVVEQELWCIYTFYTLHTNALGPETMALSQLVRFCRDCQIFSPAFTREQLNIYCAKETRKLKRGNMKYSPATKRSKPLQMTYGNFLNVLMAISPQVYPEDGDFAFRRLLLENVLPLAGRRVVTNLENELNHFSVIDTMERFKAGLHGVFQFYADVATRRRMYEESDIARARRMDGNQMGQVVVTSRRASMQITENKHKIGFVEYVKFCQDFGFCVFSELTKPDCGDAFLDCTKLQANGDRAADLDYAGFKECMLRLALSAYRKAAEGTSVTSKLKALFLNMYKYINNPTGAGAAIDNHQRRDFAGSKGGDLNICGCAMFNQIMRVVWEEDDFADYLEEGNLDCLAGDNVLQRVLGETDSQGQVRRQSVIIAKWENEQNVPESPGRARPASTPTQSPANAANNRVPLAKKKAADEVTSRNSESTITADQLCSLFRERPEITDMLANEIQEMDA
uniref:Uncharacterized protein n=1 Tax=Phaeomonas parva TaxID=124430 RepID=A0A7S1XWX3_9STRA|mmetsp:Transcript_45046/g.141081  ORF Transcript_45046/g.141081 Transcript_45046/m.141081 type:complete len:456 (+) Transcript_45046:170-1537(+)